MTNNTPFVIQTPNGKANWFCTTDQAAEGLQKLVPEVWKRLNTKCIDAPGSHYGFKYLAVSLASGIAETDLLRRREGTQFVYSNVPCCAGLLERHDFPVYYVSKSIVSALQHTHPPKGISWKEIVMPFPAVVFMLPIGMLQEPDSHYLGYIAVGHIRKGETLTIPGLNFKVQNAHDGDRICVWWAIRNGLITQDCTFPTTHLLEPDAEWINAKTEEMKEKNGMNSPDAPGSEFSVRMAGLAANLLLVMQARKTLVESGEKTKRVLKSGLPVHSPTWIGRKYEILKKEHVSSTPGAHFTELGWRAGHLKRQHYGVGNLEVRTIFVDPYMAYTRGLKGAE